jgi:pentatricopeptide repeat protein
MTITCPGCQSENDESARFCSECGTELLAINNIDVTRTVETPKKELTTGSTFAGRYQIIEELGKGGMGRVYKVLDQETNEKIALKLIKPEIAADKNSVERFCNELTTARKISHKNICRMYDLGRDKGSYFIAMEYVPGEDLKSFIRQAAPLSAARTISIAKQVCEGLSEAHKLGVVHRDLKPQNIMIDKLGHVRIMDFGIARTIKAKRITGAGTMIGTPEYMSPEQVEGKEVDQRSDLYSLGVILYEMVTGQVPFTGDTPFTIGVKHKSEVPKDPLELNPQMPDDLGRIILKCLEKDKGKRFQSAGEVRSDLEGVEAAIPFTERIVPKRKTLTSKEITVTFGLRKILIPALAAAGLIIGAVIIWRLIPNKGLAPVIQGDEPTIAVLYFENNSGKEGLDHWRSGLSELMITDLNQSKFVRVLSSDRIYSLMDGLDLLEKAKYSTEDLMNVANQGGASHVLKGSFITAGGQFIINAALMNMRSSEAVSSIRQEGIGEASITASLDKITQQIKKDLNFSPEQISSDLDKALSQITTQSPEAFKYYAEGVKLNNQSRDREAIPLYERAVRIDPEFALAYRKLGVAYINLGLAAQGRKYMEKAMALKDRLSDRERYLIEGTYYHNAEDTYNRAMEAFKKLLELYPEETTANHNLALIHYNLEQGDQAAAYYERACNAGTDFVGSYTQLADCYVAMGEFDKAKQVLEDYLKNKGESAEIRRGFSSYYRLLGKYDLALAEVNKALSLDPDHFLSLMELADVYKSQNEFAKAENVYWKLSGFTEPQAGYLAVNGAISLNLLWGKYREAQSWLNQGIGTARELNVKWPESEWNIKSAYVYNQIGRYEEALKECEMGLENARQAARDSFPLQRSAMHMEGLIHLANHSIDKAQITAGKLKDFIDAGLHKKSMRLYYHLSGMIELEKGNYSQAVELIQKAYNLTSFKETPEAQFMESLALAYYRSGDLDKALEQCEKIISLTPGGMFYGDIYTRGVYLAGKIYEEKENKDKAIEHCVTFLELWKDADPALPEVEDARKRLADLKS